MAIPTALITGLVLAGGRGSRMGHADKGLVLHRGNALASLALKRLGPQVGAVAVNANRNLAAYEAMGVPVWPDEVPDLPGPLAGVLAGLGRCKTPYLVTVPCDALRFPLDLVDRLSRALAAGDADMAVAALDTDGERRLEPVFCLLKTSLQTELDAFLARGERRVGTWIRSQRHATVVFASADNFANLNTPADLEQAATGNPPRR